MSDSIQFGSETLNEDGTRPTITISGVTGYNGLIKNGTNSSNGQNTISVVNLTIAATGGSTLSNSAGWLGQSFFGRGASSNRLVNCVCTADVTNSAAGGFLGAYAAQLGGDVTILYCYTTGAIAGNGAGGIVGNNAGAGGGTVTVEQCFSTGAFTNSSSGGIFGSGGGAGCTATKCYSTGSLNNFCGGIYGENSSGTATACYSTGAISGLFAGGIFGSNCSGTATNCYSTGAIGSSAGGIAGSSFTGSVFQCYTSGARIGSTGGIKEGSAADGVTNYSEGNDGSSGWNTTRATTTLTGVGTTWISIGLGQPFVFGSFGTSPYTLTGVADGTLIQTFSQTVAAGQASIAAVVSGYKTFEILSGGDATITISGTGVISTTADTPVGTYTLVLYAVDDYTVTTFSLSVTAAEVAAALDCCSRNLDLKGVDYRTRNEILAGNMLIGGIGSRRQPMTYSDMIQMKMAYAAKN